jgi:hypothetical protein
MCASQTRLVHRTPGTVPAAASIDSAGTAEQLAARLDDLLEELLSASGRLPTRGPLRRMRLERHIASMDRAERLRLAGALHLLSLSRSSGSSEWD